MRLAGNLAMGLANAGWTLLVSLVAIPVYINRLGVEAYGLVGFLVTLQAMLQLLDFGLAATVNREVARHRALAELGRLGGMLRTLAAWSWGLALLIAILIGIASPWLGGHWLLARQMPATEVSNAVALIGVLIACRWPIALYQAVLFGAERLATASWISIAMVTLTHLGGICVLVWVSSSVFALFAWQGMVALAQVLLLRREAWKIVGAGRHAPAYSLHELRGVWRFSAGMGLVGATGLLLGQIDKVVLSRMLDLGSFGRYALATTVIGSFAVIVTPIFNAFFPRLSALLTHGRTPDVAEAYVLGTRLIASILFPVAAILVVFGDSILLAWTGNRDIAITVAPILGLLAMGSAIHGAMHMPYALQVAAGNTRIPLRINALLIAVFIPLLVLLAARQGAIGAARAWLLLHLLYLGIGIVWTHRGLLPEARRGWLLHGVGLPLLVALMTAAFAHFVARPNLHGLATELACAGVLLCVSIACCTLLAPSIRGSLLREFDRFRSELQDNPRG
jgi:O-antigen/teichoic acid export membrane protein